MLSKFLEANRAELISRCKVKAAERNDSGPVSDEHGIPQFIAQLIATFRQDESHDAPAGGRARDHSGRPSLGLVPAAIQATAGMHGDELGRRGVTIDQVVHDYGDLCQAVTELAMEKGAPISVDEFHTFNRCLDDAIAGAVTAFSRNPVPPVPQWDSSTFGSKPESVEQQIRGLIKTAILTFAAIRAGQVGLKGSTGTLHESCLAEMRDLLNRAPGNSRLDANVGSRAGP